jgi:hypothetical protein
MGDHVKTRRMRTERFATSGREAASKTPAIAACLGQAIDTAREDAEQWAYVIEIEKKLCTVPGLVDGGQHIILATVRD